MNISGFAFYKKNYIFLESIVYTIAFHLQFLCVAGYLKRSNDTPELNIHKYANYNIIKIYINRLSTTMQTVIAIDYLIMMLEKYHEFRKRQKHVLWKYFSNFVYLKDVCKTLKESLYQS